MLNDVMTQIQNDFDLNLRAIMRNIPTLEEYLNRHPEDRPFVENFNLQTLIQDPAYRQRVGEFGQRYLLEMHLIGQGAQGADALRIELNQNTPEEIAYQERLKGLLKGAFLEIHDTAELSDCLDRGNPGAELLGVLDPTIFPPLTAYTQYKELLEPIQCPAQFAGNLVQFAPRRAELIAAQNSLRELNDGERQSLVQKLLRGGNFQVTERVKQRFIAINKLAAPLLRGPLVTKVAIDLNNLGHGELIDAKNIFNTACQEALAEIGNR